jgi:hypothetical protein
MVVQGIIMRNQKVKGTNKKKGSPKYAKSGKSRIWKHRSSGTSEVLEVWNCGCRKTKTSEVDNMVVRWILMTGMFKSMIRESRNQRYGNIKTPEQGVL